MAQILKFKGDYNGLDNQKVEHNLNLYDHNSEIKQDDAGGLRVYGVFKSLRLYLMLAACFLYFLGNNYIGGALLLLLTVLYCTLEIIKGKVCDEKMHRLTSAAEVTVRVVRDGGIVLIKRENIVQDDLIILQGGENVPADAHILEAYDVAADESAFTKLSNPVKKAAGSDGKNELKQSCVYRGTKIVSGILIARVFATGQDAKIRPKMRSAKEAHYTEFEAVINKITRVSVYVAAVLLIIAVAVKFLSTPFSTDGLLPYLSVAFLPAISFALCAIPANTASLVRVYYTFDAVSLSHKYGEIKHIRALETLNSVTAVCVGKEYVISAENTPVVGEYSANKGMLTKIAALSCKTAPADSYEKAVFLSAAFKHIDVRELHENRLVKSYCSDTEENYNKINGNLWNINGTSLLCVKGEPEAVLSFCKPPSDQLYAIQKKQQEFSKMGHQVFAVAFEQVSETDGGDGDYTVPKTLYESELTFLGLIAFSGNIKESVPGAVKNCYRAGVKVILMTPDSKETALTVADKIGLKSGGIIVGEELERISRGGDRINISGVNVFSGVTPSQKSEVVRLLRDEGEIVAVFGSDSSDTEALETADVGIALSKYTTEREWDMNIDTLSQSTTGSACEACDFIMEGDGFVKAADTFREARQMHRNIKRCVSTAVSAFTVLLPFALINFLLSDSPFVLDAVFTSMLTVLVIPLIMLAFIKNRADLKSPLKPSAFIGRGKISRGFMLGAVIQGGSLLLVELVLFFVMPENKGNPDMYRSIFAAVFFSGLISMAWVGLSFEKPFYHFLSRANNPIIAVGAALMVFLPLAVYLPFINTAFGFGYVHPVTFILCVIIGAVSQIWFDFVKKRFNR